MTNILEIAGKSDITLRTPKGVMSGWRWDGRQLKHVGGHVFEFNGETTARINDAVAAYIPMHVEQKLGPDIQDENREGWKFVRVVNDAHPLYERVTGGRVIRVEFAKEDLIQG